MRYTAGLDGLRTLAVLAVIAFHSLVATGDSWAPLSSGFLGVDVFFVLSGYLITGLLIEEYNQNDRINYPAFMARRLLRLMPALVLFLAVYLICAPIFWPKIAYSAHLIDALVAVTYFTDYDYALNEVPVVIRHMWSLSIEMHFYLIWPLVIPYIIRSGHPLKIVLACFVIASLWRCALFMVADRWLEPYARFDTRLSGLFLGAAVAFWLHSHAKQFKIPGTVGFAALVGIVASMQMHVFKTLAPVTWGMTLVELCTAILVIMLVQNRSKSIVGVVLSHPWMVKIGALSYGMYLWHYPIAFYLRGKYDYWIVVTASILVSVLFAKLSYETVEAWGRRMQKRMAAPSPIAKTQAATA